MQNSYYFAQIEGDTQPWIDLWPRHNAGRGYATRASLAERIEKQLSQTVRIVERGEDGETVVGMSIYTDGVYVHEWDTCVPVLEFISDRTTETLEAIRKVLVAKLARHVGEGAGQLADEIMLGGIVTAVCGAVSDAAHFCRHTR